MIQNRNYKRGRGFAQTVDWWLVAGYLLLVLIGWLNIFASVYDPEVPALSFASRSGKQFVWILGGIGLAALILFVIPPRIYEPAALPTYAVTVLLLIAVIFLGTAHKGSRSWFEFGPISFQPAEISKIATSLMLAAYMGRYGFKLSNRRNLLTTLGILGLPMLAILCENETGSILVYIGFLFMLYREGMSGWVVFFLIFIIALFITTLLASPFVAILMAGTVISLCVEIRADRLKLWLCVFLPTIVLLSAYGIVYHSVVSANPECGMAHVKPILILIPFIAAMTVTYIIRGFRELNWFRLTAAAAFIVGIAMTFSVQFIFNNVLQDHQRKRIEVLLGMKEDPNGVGYNVRQSMIAIGSGGFFGKGYLHGTQTSFGFVPEQSTDFIFCTIGEEWGFFGSAAVILLYVFLIWRIMRASENSRENFTRIYGYCVASCIFMHVVINIGMTIGLMPVIGIPLPLLSYGGSSLWSFTVMLFIFIAMQRNERRYF